MTKKDKFSPWDEFYNNYYKKCKQKSQAFANYRRVRLMRAKKVLTDEQVIWARTHIKELNYSQIAKELEISYHACQLMIKGETYKHLNEVAKPQR